MQSKDKDIVVTLLNTFIDEVAANDVVNLLNLIEEKDGAVHWNYVYTQHIDALCADLGTTYDEWKASNGIR